MPENGRWYINETILQSNTTMRPVWTGQCCMEVVISTVDCDTFVQFLQRYEAKSVRKQLVSAIYHRPFSGIRNSVPVGNGSNIISVFCSGVGVHYGLGAVFDASAEAKVGMILNGSLYRGPVLVPDLAGILLWFREKKFVLLGDVEKAYLQIGLNDSDREVTRFLRVYDLRTRSKSIAKL